MLTRKPDSWLDVYGQWKSTRALQFGIVVLVFLSVVGEVSSKCAQQAASFKAEADLEEWNKDCPKYHLTAIHASRVNTDKPMFNPADPINRSIQSITNPLNRSNTTQISRRCFSKSNMTYYVKSIEEVKLLRWAKDRAAWELSEPVAGHTEWINSIVPDANWMYRFGFVLVQYTSIRLSEELPQRSTKFMLYWTP